jgi:salicylate hydroxylase
VRVIIAGGGTGGLATAIALRKAGIEPLVLEQAPAFTAIGAGLGLYANAMKALSYLGADGCWRRTAARIDVSEQRGLGDDELITASSLEPRAAKYGEPYYCGHRADLLTSLLAALPAECVRTGGRVVAFEETARDVRVELGCGEEVRGDLLVGADDLSRGRRCHSATTRRSWPGSGRGVTCCCTRSGTTGTRTQCGVKARCASARASS